MKIENKLKIFRKPSIGYLKKLYKNSISNIFDINSWKSNSTDSFGESKILLHTRKSLKRFGNELKIFKVPSIVGLKIIYYKSLAFVFDRKPTEPQTALISEDNFLYRDLSSPDLSSPIDVIDHTPEQTEKELKIFKYPNIDYLKSLYYRSIGKI